VNRAKTGARESVTTPSEPSSAEKKRDEERRKGEGAEVWSRQ
jgi:hypothetical protein